jgi:alpha-D-xyloside xylohydrolase
MPSPRVFWFAASFTALPFLAPPLSAAPALLNRPVDVSADYVDADNTYFLPDTLANFDPATGAGAVQWKRTRLGTSMTFDSMSSRYEDAKANEWPGKVYADNPALPFQIDFLSADTLRVRLQSSATARPRPPSIMLAAEARGDRLPHDTASWKSERITGGHRFTSAAGSVLIREKPWAIELRDAAGRLLTQTVANSDGQPFSFVRRSSDYARRFSAVFALAPGEKIFGGGESFTRLDKRGQKLVLASSDSFSTEKTEMYKPVPFFLSSAGYGVFLHTSAPTTFDFGATLAGRTVLTTGDDALDLFIFLGSPKEVVGAYTAVTGRATMPPLWSFGLWMSRITYKSETETRDVAAKLRENRIPADVIHLDTGWFENDWQCDFEFSKTRFADPKKLIADLGRDGFHVSLWQLPYFIPGNPLFPEILAKHLAVVDAKGNPPAEDAVLDFSNPATVTWYQQKLAGLLRLGVGAIKTDFGEAAPYNGLYASGSTGFYEHNLYPVRYQEAAAAVTREITGDTLIWARAGWAGAQRNAVHWGGDSGKTFSAMAGTLRAGLSIGVCGYSFWSHDIGGFAGRNDLDVFRAWAPFGLLSSHSRVHGEPPKEPWLLGPDFLAEFRLSDELRYRLMPYIYAQAKDCSERGLPMVRALFFEYPEDPGAWLVEDQYLFGSDLLVAPLFEAGASGRQVYLPGKARWTDYQSGKIYPPGWNRIASGPVPAVILVRDGAAIPRIALAQSTQDLDWTKLELAVFAPDAASATGLVCLPGDKVLRTLELPRVAAGFALKTDPLTGKVAWTITGGTTAAGTPH